MNGWREVLRSGARNDISYISDIVTVANGAAYIDLVALLPPPVGGGAPEVRQLHHLATVGFGKLLVGQRGAHSEFGLDNPIPSVRGHSVLAAAKKCG